MKINLETIALQVRKDILTMSNRANSAHVGGALSAVEIMVSLYFEVMNVYPKDPENPNRDRLIFSKAHDAKVLYSVLARRGFYDTKILEKYEVDDGVLAGHSIRHAQPGIEVSAGSLGHGLSMACGISYAIKNYISQPTTHNPQRSRVFAVISDGECDSGATWEASLFAGHHHLDNLVAIIDYNKLQGYGYTKDILELEPFASKWQSFGWGVREVDGHDMKKIISVLSKLPFEKNKPSLLIAHTIKGKGGVPKHVNQISSQYKSPTKEELEELFPS